jgi:hypothetical protein
MAALRPLCRVLLYAIIFGGLAFDAPPSDASVVVPPARASAMEALLDGDSRGGSEAVLLYAYGGRFCRWYPDHPLCAELVSVRDFCDRHPDHHLCDDEAPFCRRHPDHPRCDDQPPSPN